MEARLSRWGVGPRIFAPSLAYAVAAWAASFAWPGIFRLPSSGGVRVTAGAILTALGLVLWIAGVITVMRAYDQDRLVTSGAFALVRHPVYAAWITLVFPGLALLSGSWPMLLTPLIAYAIFRRLIRREDEYLEKRFGRAYLDYCRRVNEVIPIPWFRRKSG